MVDTNEENVIREVEQNMAAGIEEMIKVLIVDDNDGVRAGIRSILARAGDIEVIGEAADGDQAIRFIQGVVPDVVLLDIEMPGMRGDHVMRWIHEAHPELRVLAVSSHMDGEYVRNMLEGGASGYISKDEAPEVLLEAIHAVFKDGVSWFSPTVLKYRGDRFIEEQTLTEREVHILQQLLMDRSLNEIAEFMGMDPVQVGKYLDLMKMKFRVDTLAELKDIAARILPGRTQE